VDEGNNWINMSWGPLAETNPVTGTVLGNYAPASATSPTVNYISSVTAAANYTEAPPADFFGNARKNGFVDAGAVEFTGTGGGLTASFTLAPSSLAFGNQPDRTTSASRPVTLTNTGTSTLTGIVITFTGTNSTVFRQTNNCPVTVAVGGTCTINVSFAPGVGGSSTSAGLKSVNLSVAATGATTQTVALTGTTTVATVSFSAPAPSLVTGTTTAHTATVTLTNNATSTNPGPLTISATPTVVRTVGTGAFAVVAGGTCTTGTVVAAGGSCTIVVRYTPVDATTATAHVNVVDTGATSSNQNSASFNAN